MAAIDTKTGKPWPAPWPTRKLNQIKKQCSDQLRARDMVRGIPESGQVYDTKLVGEGDTAKAVLTINPILAEKRHTFRELRQLYEARYAEFCSVPQDLDAFKAEFETPDASELKAKQAAAADIEESLKEEIGAEKAPVAKLSKKVSKPKTAEPTE